MINPIDSSVIKTLRESNPNYAIAASMAIKTERIQRLKWTAVEQPFGYFSQMPKFWNVVCESRGFNNLKVTPVVGAFVPKVSFVDQYRIWYNPQGDKNTSVDPDQVLEIFREKQSGKGLFLPRKGRDSKDLLRTSTGAMNPGEVDIDGWGYYNVLEDVYFLNYYLDEVFKSKEKLHDGLVARSSGITIDEILTETALEKKRAFDLYIRSNSFKKTIASGGVILPILRWCESWNEPRIEETARIEADIIIAKRASLDSKFSINEGHYTRLESLLKRQQDRMSITLSPDFLSQNKADAFSPLVPNVPSTVGLRQIDPETEFFLEEEKEVGRFDKKKPQIITKKSLSDAPSLPVVSDRKQNKSESDSELFGRLPDKGNRNKQSKRKRRIEFLT